MNGLSRPQALLVIGTVMLAGLLLVGGYGLIHGPHHGAQDRSRFGSESGAASSEAAGRPAVGQAGAGSNALTAGPAALPRTTDPIAYARAIATSLFTWDTATGLLPTDYTAAVLADADPSGEETPGLVTDVSTYLPTLDQWLDLGAMSVRQTLTITAATVPAAWATALEQAHGSLRPGTTAVTITATRHRTGTWNGQTATATTPVAFTAFVACPPAFDRCHVLRLSQLNNPLR